MDSSTSITKISNKLSLQKQERVSGIDKILREGSIDQEGRKGLIALKDKISGPRMQDASPEDAFMLYQELCITLCLACGFGREAINDTPDPIFESWSRSFLENYGSKMTVMQMREAVGPNYLASYDGIKYEKGFNAVLMNRIMDAYIEKSASMINLGNRLLAEMSKEEEAVKDFEFYNQQNIEWVKTGLMPLFQSIKDQEDETAYFMHLPAFYDILEKTGIKTISDEEKWEFYDQAKTAILIKNGIYEKRGDSIVMPSEIANDAIGQTIQERIKSKAKSSAAYYMISDLVTRGWTKDMLEKRLLDSIKVYTRYTMDANNKQTT